MSNKLKKAIVKATGKEVEVYRHASTGGWVDFSDCKTIYKPEEVEIK